MLKLWLVRANHLETSELKPLLAEHLKEFKRVFGSGDEKEAG